MPAVAFVSDQSAVSVDASLRRSLAAAEQAHQCAVLWFDDQKLGFSRSRAEDFIRLARRLETLPRVRAAVAEGKRDDLVDEVRKVKRAARADPGQGQLLPSPPTVVAPRELPVRFQVDLTPEQEARRSALVEQLHKLGGAPADRAELMAEVLAALVEVRQAASESDNIDSTADLLSGGPF